MTWQIEPSDQFNRDFKKLGGNEQEALAYNLQIYHESLNSCKNPIQIQHGFLHPEPMGIKAIDQGGGSLPGGKKRPKMKEIRLYTYSNLQSNTLHLLFIGDKTSQNKDIQFAKKMVAQILKNTATE